MITPTNNPHWLRCRLSGLYSGLLTRANVICYLEITSAGLSIYYSHHEFFHRPAERSPWARGEDSSVPMSPALSSLIEAAVMCEFWDYFVCRGSGRPTGKVEAPGGGIKVLGQVERARLGLTGRGREGSTRLLPSGTGGGDVDEF
jgi:hypothetical protein